MTGTRRDAATEAQVNAADPAACTWLSANAGSGKTKVLTDRVARLLLADAAPTNILCLTYTKAAASEMQNRLFRRLGGWAMLDDGPLSEELDRLGLEGPFTAGTLAKARRLFARAIETPGGLKIQTIHSFCASVLRRFPLEAGLAPGFTEMDDVATARLQAEVLAHVAAVDPDAFAGMARLVTDTDMAGLCAEIAKHRTALPDRADPAAIWAQHGLPQGYAEADARAGVLHGILPSVLEDLAAVLDGQSKTMVELAADLRAAARGPLDEALFGSLCGRCLYAASHKETPLQPKPGALTKGARTALGESVSLFEALQDRLATAVDEIRCIAAAERTLALHRFAAAFLPEFAARKAARGWLDFDDLIQRTEALLGTPGVAEWVLYRLDGAIDHILVDEAQDTSPLQWQVIEHLTREMTAGAGAESAGLKTLFVVGDLKQSIYSFQGADPAGFERMRTTFDGRLRRVGTTLSQMELRHSFRSAPEILETVDNVFSEERRAGLGKTVEHIAFHDTMPGRVDLWPHLPPSDKGEGVHWTDPAGQISEEHHSTVLAEQVAGAIRRMIDEDVLWDRSDGGWTPRRITEGDVLILVQSRGALFHAIIAAAKRAGLAVAGADVLRLGEELAVRDLQALLSFLATPEDDLSLAAALRSPLFGWSEAALFDLAAGRSDMYLWQTLRRRETDHPQTVARLRALRDAADFLRPFELLQRILVRDGGRHRLIGRLGSEAADGIDAVVAQALAYEQEEPPSLTGFLARMERTDIAVKRRAEGRGDKLRVMTVHGAKGLESPIVILPDTAEKRKQAQVDDRLLPLEEGPPIWRPPGNESPRHSTALVDTIRTARLEERQRLLYVAMTRAEQWLIVAGAGSLGSKGDTWYEQVRDGLLRRGAGSWSFEGGEGLRLETSGRPAPGTLPDRDRASRPAPRRPDWVERTPPPCPDAPAPVSPSDLGGAKVMPGEADALDAEAAKERGTRLHLLLEHLPGLPHGARAAHATRLLGDAPDVGDLLAEATAVLDSPDLAEVFAGEALTEVEIVSDLPELGGPKMRGAIDRLLVSETRVTAIDFKSNAAVPGSAEQVPEGLLRQMGAYAAALARIYPGREIRTAILWTRTAHLMPLTPALTAAALSRAAGLREGEAGAA